MNKLVVVEAEELRRLIAEAVAEALPRVVVDGEWIDARTSGLGRRTFLRLAREGAFPVSKVGKRYVARRVDVAAYLEKARIHDVLPPGPPSAPVEEQEPKHRLDPRERRPALDADDPVAKALAAGRLRVLKRPT